MGEGLDPECVVLDPGPDFTKTPAESIAVLREFGLLNELGRPVLAAISRKYFLGAITATAPDDRLPETLAARRILRAGGCGDPARARRRRGGAPSARRPGAGRRRAELGAFDADDERLKWIRPGGGVGSQT